MNRLLSLLAAFCVVAFGFVAIAHADDAVHVRVHETLPLQFAGVTAAYSIDDSIADASVSGGMVTISGRTPGRTRINLVLITGTRSIEVMVDAIPRPVSEAEADAVRPRSLTYASHFDSGSHQLQNSVDAISRDGAKTTELHVTTVSSIGRSAFGARNALPSVSYVVTTPARRLTLFDSYVQNSPLTLDGTVLRGVHLEQGNWRLHAGYTASTFYDGFLLPAQREIVVGASYIYSVNPALRLMPSLYVFPTRNAAAPNRRGAVASLLLDYAPGEQFHVRTELGISRSVGAALQLSSNTAWQQLKVDMRLQPRDFAAAGPVDLHGFYSDLSWNARLGSRTEVVMAASVNHYLLPQFQQDSATGNLSLRYRVTRSLSLLSGASYGKFTTTRPVVQTVSSFVVPIGAAFDTAHVGVSAIARIGNSSSGQSRGYRLTARASLGHVFGSAYFDRQTDVPSLQLIFRERPDIALGLEELGLSASTPQEIARILHDDALLLRLGIVGASVDLSPKRTQAGMELSWLGAGESRQQVQVRALQSRIAGISSDSTTSIASVAYSRAITPSADVRAGITMRFSKSGGTTTREPSIELGVRQRLSGFPTFGDVASGVISGAVFLDDELTGDARRNGRGVAGVQIFLEDGRFITTDASGHYRVTVSGGSHSLRAILPSGETYFTTPSRVDAERGATVDFGVAVAAARFGGSIVSDAGNGVGGVSLTLTRGQERVTARSASDGRFSVAMPPGSWSVAVDRDSLPAGYTLRDEETRQVTLVRAAAVSSSFRVQAFRSISGRVTSGGATVEVPALGKRIESDSEGRFVLRSLPAGPITIVVRKGSRSTSRNMTLDAVPMNIKDVVIDLNTK
jgi:hypothetical protein